LKHKNYLFLCFVLRGGGGSYIICTKHYLVFAELHGVASQAVTERTEYRIGFQQLFDSEWGRKARY